MLRELEFGQSGTKIPASLREDPSTFVAVSQRILQARRNVSDESCRETQTTYVMSSNFFSGNSAAYEKITRKIRQRRYHGAKRSDLLPGNCDR